MGCGVSNEMPLVEEDAISKDVRQSKDSSSGGAHMFCSFHQLLFTTDSDNEADTEDIERPLKPSINGRIKDGIYIGAQKLNTMNMM